MVILIQWPAVRGDSRPLWFICLDGHFGPLRGIGCGYGGGGYGGGGGGQGTAKCPSTRALLVGSKLFL